LVTEKEKIMSDAPVETPDEPDNEETEDDEETVRPQDVPEGAITKDKLKENQ
jgi:hypothetical protein